MAKDFLKHMEKTMSKRDLKRGDARARQLRQEMLLGELRKAAGLSQKELAELTKIKQPNISRLEKSDDAQITTLAKIIQSLGGQLEVVAKFGNHEVRLTQFGGLASI